MPTEEGNIIPTASKPVHKLDVEEKDAEKANAKKVGTEEINVEEESSGKTWAEEVKENKAQIKADKEKLDNNRIAHIASMKILQLEVNKEKRRLAQVEIQTKQAELLENEKNKVKKLVLQRKALEDSLNDKKQDLRSQVKLESILDKEALAQPDDSQLKEKLGILRQLFFWVKPTAVSATIENEEVDFDRDPNEADKANADRLEKEQAEKVDKFKVFLAVDKEKLELKRVAHQAALNTVQMDIKKEKSLIRQANLQATQAEVLGNERRKASELALQRKALENSLEERKQELLRQLQLEVSLEKEVSKETSRAKPKKNNGSLLQRLFALKKATVEELASEEEEVDSKADAIEIDAAIKKRVGNIATKADLVLEQAAFIKAEMFQFPETQEKMQDYATRLHKRIATIETSTNNINGQSAVIEKRVEALARVIARKSHGGAKWAVTDKLSLTDDWETVKPKPQSPFVMRKRGRIDVLFLNSMGGSMSRLSKGLMLNENVVSDCMISAYYPRRHLVYPHETNVFGVFNHQEWRDYMQWAVGHYDIIQTTSLPLWPGVAECYDWLTETLGRRHIWRTTGFIHHYLLREDIISLQRYQNDLKTENKPSPDRLLLDTFKVKGNHFLTDPNVVFYSSPEKGAYLKGKDNYWLPSIRDDEAYSPDDNYKVPTANQNVKIYVPHHDNAVFKGLDKAIAVLQSLKNDGYKIQIVTPENATDLWPDLRGFKEEKEGAQRAGVYPVPNHLMPVLFSRVDLVIDQIVMGCYGNTGIEAMMSGKPVLGQKKFDEVVNCPVIDVTGDTLRGKIIELLENRESWKAIGEAGREYALNVHSSQAVSKIAADTYRMILDE